MPPFLSDEWIEALDRAVSTDAELAGRAAGVALVVQYVVTGDDGEPERTYHLEVADGRVRARPGPAASPTVVFTVDRATAEAVADGRERAQVAFMGGRLRLGGDVAALLAHRSLLTQLHDVTAEAGGR